VRRFLGGDKATLLWDGLPAHRSNAMRAWLSTQRSWLVVECLPAYAPELNRSRDCGPASRPSSWPTWPASLAEVIDQAHRGIDPGPADPHLAYSFLRHAGLSVS
jgi:DDE superfamily endonuclease